MGWRDQAIDLGLGFRKVDWDGLVAVRRLHQPGGLSKLLGVDNGHSGTMPDSVYSKMTPLPPLMARMPATLRMTLSPRTNNSHDANDVGTTSDHTETAHVARTGIDTSDETK